MSIHIACASNRSSDPFWDTLLKRMCSVLYVVACFIIVVAGFWKRCSNMYVSVCICVCVCVVCVRAHWWFFITREVFYQFLLGEPVNSHALLHYYFTVMRVSYVDSTIVFCSYITWIFVLCAPLPSALLPIKKAWVLTGLKLTGEKTRILQA